MRLIPKLFLSVFFLASTLSSTAAISESKPQADIKLPGENPAQQQASINDSDRSTELAVATFAGGCFWCMEPPYDNMPGVVKTISGYMGGTEENANYDKVSSGKTRHREVIQITYDPKQVSYEDLLYVFWRNVDPLEKSGQFCDFGPQYTSAAYYSNENEKRLAWKSLQDLRKNPRFGQKVVTSIEKAGEFYPAEDYHQDYYQRNPLRYKYYRYRCGRDGRLETLWGDEARGEKWKPKD